MEDKKNNHDFLTINDLETFNDKVNRVVLNKKPQEKIEPTVDNDGIVDEVPYDSSQFQSVIEDPKNIPEGLLQQLADIIDKKSHYSVNDNTDNSVKGPNTIDRLSNSIAIAYISKDGIPVAVGTLVDPTIENYKGIIPSDYYELKSGKPLENRVQQDFFAVTPENHDKGIAQELKQLLSTITPNMFVINSVTDKETSTGLFKNGYKLLTRFNTEWESEPIELWVN